MHLTEDEKRQYAEENQRLISWTANRFSNYPVDKEELVSIAMVGFTNALNNFQKDKGAKFSTFAVKCMTNELLHALRNESKHIKNSILSGTALYTDSEGNSLTIEDTLSAEMNNESSLEDSVMMKEDYKLLREAIETLPEREQEVIRRRYGIDCDPETQNDIAVSLNMSQANVSKIEQSIIKKLYIRMKGQVQIEDSNYYTD